MDSTITKTDTKTALSIIVPCYNEEEGIPKLAQKLNSAVADLRIDYTVELIFVDDGSTDKTNELLHNYFGADNRTVILKHEKNKNLGAALQTGFAHASGNLVAALDSDCTYDPRLLAPMLKMIDEKTDIVTVSPYHPKGKIEGVPWHRTLPSRSVSTIYRALVDPKVYTYSAMVRVYKNQVIKNVEFRHQDFLSVTEIMVRAILSGYNVKELPTPMKLREHGASKIKIYKEIRNHLNFIFAIMAYRLTGREL